MDRVSMSCPSVVSPSRASSPARKVVFELCVDNLDAAIAGARGGADRIELCSALALGGLTPSPELLTQTLRYVALPVHVMVRPSAGSFVCTAPVFAMMEQDLLFAKHAGAAGIVFGLLNEDGTVDIPHTRRLVELASPLPVTFHRAFDQVPDPAAALEVVIECGVHRVLTSGRAASAAIGAEAIAQLVRQAADRIDIAIGGGLHSGNVIATLRRTGAPHVHASLQEGTAATTTERKVHDFAAIVHHLQA